MDNTSELDDKKDTQSKRSETQKAVLEHMVMDEPVQPKASEYNSSPSKKDTSQELLDRVKTGERWMICLTFLIFVVSAFQACESWNNNRATSHQADRLIQAANGVNVAAGQFSASAKDIDLGVKAAVQKLEIQSDAATHAIKDQHSYFVMQERPYIVVGTTHLAADNAGKKILTQGQPVVWYLETSNYGKTPAVHVHEATAVFFGATADHDAAEWMNEMPKDSHSKRFIGPGSTSMIPPRISGEKNGYSSPISKRILTADDIAYVGSHEFAIFLVGRIFYEDLQGHQYYTDLCRQQLLSGAVGSCGKYNEEH